MEVGKRTADRVLSIARDAGLIDEQYQPRQHRPRTWRLNLEVLAALSESQTVATLEPSSEANDACETALGSPNSNLDTPNQRSDTPNRASDTQHVPTEQSFERSFLNSPLERTHSHEKNRKNEDEDEDEEGEKALYRHVRGVADEHVLSVRTRADLVEKVQQLQPSVHVLIVERACTAACFAKQTGNLRTERRQQPA
jgi:hypothetical protein